MHRIESLGKGFNTTVVEIERLVKRVEEETVKQQQSRLEALQAQISPHFLINTLNSIRWMATMSGNQNVAHMISRLGKLLEGSIYTTSENITLREELDYLSAYIEIQRMRFGNQFIVQYFLEEETMDCLLPPFILQPIIENAIIHGIRQTGGTIQISSKRQEEFLLIEISDDGVGIPKENLEQSLKDSSRKGRFSGIGLPNVNERIKLAFGQSCGLKIQSEEGCGTVVQITLLYHRQSE